MDRRSWPWKKKSSEKSSYTADSTSSFGGNQVEQSEAKTVSYIQISLESYKHLTELEDQVNALNEKLSAAQTDITTKETLVKQHTKVAEEAVSGWEKAESEASALKQQLESVTLLKLTVEERVSHLDAALKECMKQIRIVKEESEQKLHDVVFAKTKQWEKVKAELEVRISDFEQELLKASAENAALSRSFQERLNILMKVTDEKTQAEAEIEVLKSNLQSCERENSSLKYELHIVSKELEIRNEEKNMSLRSADVANKQHLEDVKKISKLEAECQRLRGLVRKKLPGPAAIAQMKLEVENLSRDYEETRLRRSPAKHSSPRHVSSPTDFAFENIQQFQKENEFLTARLLAMEEETKMLKEALSKRNSELQASRNMCAKTANKLRSMETEMQSLSQQRSPSKSNIDVSFDTSLNQNESNPPSLTSMSEDGIDEEGSCSESWATALISELSQFKKQKDVGRHSNADNSNHLELMDDFLEMEKLACLPTESNGTVTVPDGEFDKRRTENCNAALLTDVQKDVVSKEQELTSNKPTSLHNSSNNCSKSVFVSNKVDSPLSKLKSRVSSIFESQGQDPDIGRLLEDIKQIMQDVQEELPQHAVSSNIEESHSPGAFCDQKHCHEGMGETTDNGISSNQSNVFWINSKHDLDQELKNAISEIHDFVMCLGKEAIEVQDRPSNFQGLSEKIVDFSSSVKKVVCNQRSLCDFILVLSHILSEASEMSFNMCSGKGNERESNISDCVDKVTLLENKVALHEPGKDNFSTASSLSHSSSHPEIEGPIGDNFEMKTSLQNFSSEEFEQMKVDKVNLEMELVSCTQLLEETKLQLTESKRNLEELKSQLAASQKSNSLAETQLKCMAESYKVLESHTQQLEAEIYQLRTKAETLNNELEEERRAHQDDLAKYKDLQELTERKEKCSMWSDADADNKSRQEKEIAAAAEKLAECQETILMLGKQLQSLRSPAEQLDSSPNSRYFMNEDFLDDVPGPRNGGESPFEGYNFQNSASDNESIQFSGSPISLKRPKPRSSRSSSSSSFSNALPEKQGRGFSRFFSKG